MKIETARDHAVATAVIATLERRMVEVVHGAPFARIVSKQGAASVADVVMGSFDAATAAAAIDLGMRPPALTEHVLGAPRVQ